MRLGTIVLAALALLPVAYNAAAAKVVSSGAPDAITISWTHATAGEVIDRLSTLVGRPIQGSRRVIDQPIADATWQGGSAESLLSVILTHADYASVSAAQGAVILITRLRGWPAADAAAGEISMDEPVTAGTAKGHHAKRPLHLSADIAEMGEQADRIQRERAAEQAAYFLRFAEPKPE